MIVADATMYPDTVIQQAIDDAQTIFGPLLQNAECGYTEQQQSIILRYIIIHYMALGVEQGGIIRKRTGDSEENYVARQENLNGLGLTNWGTQALSMDTCGVLSSYVSSPMKAQFRVV